MPSCDNCGAYVTPKFKRARSDNDGVLHGCLECTSPGTRVRDCAGVESAYNPDHPGLWTTDEDPARKIASVGMRVQGGVTTHGVAMNLINEMIGFSMISPPCAPDLRGLAIRPRIPLN